MRRRHWNIRPGLDAGMIPGAAQHRSAWRKISSIGVTCADRSNIFPSAVFILERPSSWLRANQRFFYG
jgi:hypothetical protein